MNPNLGIQFQHYEDEKSHTILPEGGSKAGQQAPYLSWAKTAQRSSEGPYTVQPGEVMGVFVPSAMRRQGVASHMWSMAKSIDPGIRHSAHQSEMGQAWAGAVEGRHPQHEVADPLDVARSRSDALAREDQARRAPTGNSEIDDIMRLLG